MLSTERVTSFPTVLERMGERPDVQTSGLSPDCFGTGSFREGNTDKACGLSQLSIHYGMVIRIVSRDSKLFAVRQRPRHATTAGLRPAIVAQLGKGGRPWGRP